MLSEIVVAIDKEIDRLTEVKRILSSADAVASSGRHKRKPMSAEVKARIAAAQRKRWAKRRKAA